MGHRIIIAGAALAALLACGGGGGGGTASTATSTGPTAPSGNPGSGPGTPAAPVISAPTVASAGASGLTASVPDQTGCTYAWSIQGGMLDSSSNQRTATFTAGASGTLTLGCTVANDYGTASSQTSVTVLPDQATGFYGSGINADALANTPIGTAAGYQVSYRIRANHTGALQYFRPFFIWSSSTAGYAAGTGGTIRIQLQSDDGTANHFPSGTVLASMTYANPVNDAVGFYPQLAFASQPALTAGTLYHLVFTNVDPDPASNWVCLDSAYMDSADSPNQPTLADADLNTLWRQGSTGAWIRRGSEYSPMESFTPILELDYADGASQGQGYMEFWIGNPKTISGAQSVRETFTVSGASRTVASAAVRVKYVSGTGPLTLRLELADGTLVDQGTVSSVPVAAGFSGESWAAAAFSTPRTLVSGQSYHLVLSAPPDTVYTTFAMREGADKGFRSTTLFADGYAQFNGGAGWTGWDMWGQSNRKDGDLEFYFATVQ